jgi:large subunit ribosomal protein L18e
MKENKKNTQNRKTSSYSRSEMDKRTKLKTNSELISLFKKLNDQKDPLYRKLAIEITKSKRKKVQVNIDKINSLTKGDEVVIVPGKVLGQGELNHSLVIAALSFSESARKKLEKKSNLMTIQEFMEKRKTLKGINLKIIT